MKTLQQQEVNAVSGGCFLGGDGEYYDLIPMDPEGRVYQLAPCLHPHTADPLPPTRRPREPQEPTRGPWR
jgi:hypothetical protein